MTSDDEAQLSNKMMHTGSKALEPSGRVLDCAIPLWHRSQTLAEAGGDARLPGVSVGRGHADLNSFILQEGQPLLDAIQVIEANRVQTAFVTDPDGVLVGLLTNGDVRRFLLRGGNTDSPVSECMNRDFHRVTDSEPREALLKLLDLGYGTIPIVDKAGRVTDFATPDYFPPSEEAEVLARARAPARLSFSGGGTDLTYYFIEEKGAVLSTSLASYAHATLIPRPTSEIHIYCLDIDREEHYSSLSDLLAEPEKSLLSAVVSVIKPGFGFELFVNSDFPVGSGLGGSSAVATSVVAAFNELRLDRWSTYEVAELSFHAERLCFGIAGGWQDQYASAFGGFNLIEFGRHRNLVHPIRLDPLICNELQECLLLCDTRIEHHSGQLHESQRKEFFEDDRRAHFKAVVDLSLEMHCHLIRGELREFGLRLGDMWTLKKRMSSKVTDARIDHIYDTAVNAGALGGKLLGAGAGGFLVFFVQPRCRQIVTNELKQLGCSLRSVRFENEGVTSWRTKSV